MRVGIQTWGSEGDLRPFFALARGLAQAGHQVALQYSGIDDREYPELLGDATFQHRRVGTLGLPAAEMTALATRVFSDQNPVRQLSSILTAMLEPMIPAMTEGARELARTSDVLVHHMMSHPLAAAAEQQRKPLVVVQTAPMMVTRAFPPPTMPDLGVLNRVMWKLVLALLDKKFLPSVSKTRAAFGLEPVKRVQQQLERSALDLCAVSPTLLPRPSDWPEKAVMSGFLSFPGPAVGEALPARVEAFLREGPPPVFITFGSMTAVEREAELVFRTVLEAVALVGCRAIVQAGALVLPERAGVLTVGPLRHEAVFPRCAAVVHHGGAGTTQAALRAGRPAVVVAHLADQFLWGHLLHRHGVGPKHLSRRRLAARPLAAALTRALTEPSMQRAAAELGAKLAAEDGVGTAVRLIEGVQVGKR